MKFIASVILALAATANTASAFAPARKSFMIMIHRKGFWKRAALKNECCNKIHDFLCHR
jgi:hypothetical protein